MKRLLALSILTLCACGDDGGGSEHPDAAAPVPDARAADAPLPDAAFPDAAAPDAAFPDAAAPDASSPDAPLPSTQAAIGEAGGMLALSDGLTLAVPYAAVDEMTTLSAARTADTPPAGMTALSPVYRFGPDGTTFDRPVAVSIPFTGDPAGAAIYWSRKDGSGYDRLGGTVSDGKITALVTHFSTGFAAQSMAGTRTVTGTLVASHHDGTKTTNVPSAGAIDLLLPDGAGGYTVHASTSAAGGAFSFTDVPDGLYFIRTSTTIHGSTASAIDLGTSPLGRPDVVAASANTQLLVSLSSMTPWKAGDFVWGYAAGANAFWFDDGSSIAAVVSPGATSVAGVPVVMNHASGGDGPLIQGTKGDRLAFVHFTTRTSGGGQPYAVAIEKAVVAPFDQTNGGDTPVSAAFAPFASSMTTSFDVRGVELDNLALAAAPDSKGTAPEVLVAAQIGPLARGDSVTMDALLVAGTAGADLVTGTMSYSEIAADQTLFGLAIGGRQRCFKVSGAGPASPSQCFPVGVLVFDSVAALAAAPIVARVGPARDLAVGVGLTPRITWSPPTVGAPTLYEVRVVRLFLNANKATRRQVVATLTTPQPEVTLPPGILQAGERYVFVVQASLGDPAAPFRDPFPRGIGSTVSTLVQR